MRSWMVSVSSVVDVNIENIVDHITPGVFMKSVGVVKERVLNCQDVSKEVVSLTKNGTVIIGNTCLKENAEMILDIYEET